MSKVVNVSFKNTEKDSTMYDYIKKLEDKSSFVKNAIWFYLQYTERDDNQFDGDF